MRETNCTVNIGAAERKREGVDGERREERERGKVKREGKRERNERKRKKVEIERERRRRRKGELRGCEVTSTNLNDYKIIFAYLDL